MKSILSYIIVSAFVFCGCSTTEKQKPSGEEADSLAVINLSDNVTKVESLLLSEAISDVQVVPLETTNESLLASIEYVQVTDDDIWITHNKDSRIYRFTRSGKFLNLVGKIGQGPGEYTRLFNYVIDETQKEVYCITTLQGIQVYDFDGKYKRRATKYNPGDMFTCTHHQYLLFNQSWFISQNLAVNAPIDNPKDSLWSIALLDSSFNKQKLFKNPDHIGNEELLVKNRCDPKSWDIVNYWVEGWTQINTYDNELTIKYPDTDSIYRYDMANQTFVPIYSIYSKEEKGDYELMHQWVKERRAIDYFTLKSYSMSKDFIYLVGNKGENIYTYCYNKHDGKVTYKVGKGKIIERKLPWFSNPYIDLPCRLMFENDITGGDFTLDYRCSGKYWVDLLVPFSEDNWIDIDAVKASTVIDEAKKEAFVNCLENVNEDSNPILLIGVLK